MSIKKYKDASVVLAEMYGTLSFGKMLWSIRKGDNLSQLEFSKKLRISTQNLSDIENERRAVSPEKAYFFAKRLAYSPEQFVRLALQDLIEKAGIKDLHVSIEKRAS
jgi:transcriptional regulator with XRE-family HTH domain